MKKESMAKQRGSSSTTNNHHHLSSSSFVGRNSDKASSTTSASVSSSSSTASSSSSSSASSIYIRYVSSLFLLCIVCVWFLLDSSSKWFSFKSLPASASSSSFSSKKSESQHHIRGGEHNVASVTTGTSGTKVKKQGSNRTAALTSSSSTTFQLETEKAPRTSTIEDEEDYILLEAYLAPLQMMRQYKQWHGVQALRKEWKEKLETNPSSNKSSSDDNRKFAVALYWCPDRAGNVLSSLFNTISWAMITNRTLLFQWDEGNPPGNDETACDSTTLQRQSSWIPLYRDWKDRLPVLLRGDYNNATTMTPILSLPMDATRRVYDETIPVVYFPMIKDVLYDNAPAKKRQDDLRPTSNILYRNRWTDHPVSLHSYRQYLLDLPPPQKQILARLYAEGVEFLFGMLMDHFFTLFPQEPPQPTEDDIATAADSSSSMALSIVLHSRHTAPSDDGSFVNYEKDCLEQILKEHVFFSNTTMNSSSSSVSLQPPLQSYQQQLQQECRIVFMSDRPRTTYLLREWIQQHDIYRACTVLTTLDDVDNNESSAGPVAEHGPHAGVGFFRDLQLVQQEQQRGATSAALIGDEARSSFSLVKNMVTYHQRVQQVKRAAATARGKNSSNDSNTTTLLKRHSTPPSWETDQGGRLPWMCTLPARPVSGYNYGPNTPAFYRNRAADDAVVPPLTKPQLLFQEYQSQHTLQALLREADTGQSSISAPSWRKFGLVTLDCADDTHDDTPHELMNSLVWAMLTNRTLLWRTGTVHSAAPYNDSNARTTNDMNTCGSLKIQSWLPRWDEWSARWNVKEPSLLDAANHDDNGGEAATTGILRTIPLPTLLRPKVVTRRKMAQQLLEYGADFLHGMLFLQVFDENPSATPEESESMTKAVTAAASSNIPHDGMANTIILEDYYDDSTTTAGGNKAPIGAHMNRVSACLDHVLGELEKNEAAGNSRTSTLKNPQPLLPCQIIRISAKNKPQQDGNGDTSLQQVLGKHNCTIILQQELQPRNASQSLSFLENVKALLPTIKDNGKNNNNNRPLFQGWIGERPSFLMEAIEYQKVTQARTRFPIVVPTVHTCDLAIDPIATRR